MSALFKHTRGEKTGWVKQVYIEMCVASRGLFTVCVRLPSSPVWVLICRTPVAEEHFTELHQRENRRTEWENQVGEASKADSLHCFHMLQHPSGNSWQAPL